MWEPVKEGLKNTCRTQRTPPFSMYYVKLCCMVYLNLNIPYNTIFFITLNDRYMIFKSPLGEIMKDLLMM